MNLIADGLVFTEPPFMEIATFSRQQHEAQPSVSFLVHDVKREAPNLPRSSMAASVTRCMKSGDNFVPEIIAVSDTEGRYLEAPAQNGFLAAVHLAFSQHLTLTLSPDMICWRFFNGLPVT